MHLDSIKQHPSDVRNDHRDVRCAHIRIYVLSTYRFVHLVCSGVVSQVPTCPVRTACPRLSNSALVGDGTERAGKVLLRVWQTHPQAQRRMAVGFSREGQKRQCGDDDSLEARPHSRTECVLFGGPPRPAEATQRQNARIDLDLSRSR